MAERCAIVGAGLGGFVAYATLRHGGLEPAEIAVFGTDPDPAAAWRVRAASIRQERMRSESDGHCFPTTFPGLAAREAARRRDLAPLLLSVCDRYRPTVTEFLRHVDELRERTRWDESFRPSRIERVAAVEGGFELDGHGVFRHVLLAPGHPGLAVPAELEGDRAGRPRIRAARVRGEGRRRRARGWRPRPSGGTRSPRAPRSSPSAGASRNGGRSTCRGRSSRSAASPRSTPRRVPSAPGSCAPSRRRRTRPGREWDEPIGRAVQEGRFRVELAPNGAEQVIAATGFRRGFEHDPLLRRLVDEHGLETEERWIVLADDSTVPSLTDASRTLSLAGVPAQWAYPAADTLVGMKYAARGFLRRVRRWPSR